MVNKALNKYRNTCAAWCLVLYTLLCTGNALASSEQEMTYDLANPLSEQEMIYDSANSFGEWEPLEVSGEAIPWDVFAKTTGTEECSVDEEGFDYCITRPGYSEDIKKYDGEEVTLMGFMFPLEQSEKQKSFLIGPYPLSCPFHYHVGPTQVIEVRAEKPVAFSYYPVTIKGVLRVRFNEETNMFYQLENASDSKAKPMREFYGFIKKSLGK